MKNDEVDKNRQKNIRKRGEKVMENGEVSDRKR